MLRMTHRAQFHYTDKITKSRNWEPRPLNQLKQLECILPTCTHPLTSQAPPDELRKIRCPLPALTHLLLLLEQARLRLGHSSTYTHTQILSAC